MTGHIRYGKIITLTSLSSYSKRTSLFGYDQVEKKYLFFVVNCFDQLRLKLSRKHFVV